MRNLTRTISRDDLKRMADLELHEQEWIVTNGLGGYASGTLSGIITRRYHGLLVAAMPHRGRLVMLTSLIEQVRLPDGALIKLFNEEMLYKNQQLYDPRYFTEFRLESGLPIWRFEFSGFVLEKRVLMPHKQNTVHVQYRLAQGSGSLRLKLLPLMSFRPHDDPVSTPLSKPYVVKGVEDRYEFYSGHSLPPLRMTLFGSRTAFTIEGRDICEVIYGVEEDRGYECSGDLWSPGYFRVDLQAGGAASLVASTEKWETIGALPPLDALRAETGRREMLLRSATPEARVGLSGELILAADQFIVTPLGRTEDEVRARAGGDEVRSIIAGYHWFTDWGRDTMISLEGLTLVTGRHLEAGYILRTFSHYVRDGLIPNMFPEGDSEGLYHTADATLWFFHAIDRYLEYTRDRATLRFLMPVLTDIIARHLRGTRFGIGVDERDGLLRQGQEGYQLTWMDAKVGGWVVTPRRGKAVEINALWYNALCLYLRWNEELGEEPPPGWPELPGRVYASFNDRFWWKEGGYLYDVVDGEKGNDDACRPNQLFAISLRHPVLDQARWEAVVTVVRERLLTPVGLRSLEPNHPDYKSVYYGDLPSRDAAYHQGTVWTWLIGPFIDAWLKLHPGDHARAREFLAGFDAHLSEAGIGTISEVFDAERPFTPRGCIAQAWSVAEVLRCRARSAPTRSEESQ